MHNNNKICNKQWFNSQLVSFKLSLNNQLVQFKLNLNKYKYHINKYDMFHNKRYYNKFL